MFWGISLENNLRRIRWELLERIKNVKLRRLTLYKAFTRGEKEGEEICNQHRQEERLSRPSAEFPWKVSCFLHVLWMHAWHLGQSGKRSSFKLSGDFLSLLQLSNCEGKSKVHGVIFLFFNISNRQGKDPLSCLEPMMAASCRKLKLGLLHYLHPFPLRQNGNQLLIPFYCYCCLILYFLSTNSFKA